jgi:hypothetical protein
LPALYHLLKPIVDGLAGEQWAQGRKTGESKLNSERFRETLSEERQRGPKRAKMAEKKDAKQKALSSQKFGFGIQDPGSEIWDPGSGKTYSGSRIRIQGSKRHQIRIRNTDENALIALRGPVGGRGWGGEPGWVRGELGGGDDRQSSCADSVVLGLAVYRALSLLVSMASIVTDGRRGGGLKQCVKLMGVCVGSAVRKFLLPRKIFLPHCHCTPH